MWRGDWKSIGKEEDLEKMESWYVGYELGSVVSMNKINKSRERIYCLPETG